MTLKTCTKCGTVLTSHGKGTQICRACFQVAPKTCSACGKELPKYARGTRCRDCWKMRGVQGQRGPNAQRADQPVPRPCDKCGRPLSKTSRPEATLCKACYLDRAGHKGFKHCLDCGVRLNRGSRGVRCWACHITAKAATAIQKRCGIEGCERPHKAKGFCLSHYQNKRRRAELLGHVSPQQLKVKRGDLNDAPCQVCGYNRLPARLHRIIPGPQGGKYVIGNIVAMCARCHEEVHSGLIPCPSPWEPSQVAHHR